MTATSTIFKYINRDEVTHLVLFQNIIKELKNENSHIFTEELEEEFRQMMRMGVEHEIQWGQYVTNNEILGLNDELIEKYIKYLSNLRLVAIGLKPLYPEINKHPMEWIDSFSKLNSTKTDFLKQRLRTIQKQQLLILMILIN